MKIIIVLSLTCILFLSIVGCDVQSSFSSESTAASTKSASQIYIPDIGMTFDEVLCSSWGAPDKMEVVNIDHKDNVMWTYLPSNTDASTRTIIFENGKICQMASSVSIVR